MRTCSFRKQHVKIHFCVCACIFSSKKSVREGTHGVFLSFSNVFHAVALTLSTHAFCNLQTYSVPLKGVYVYI